MDGKSVVTRQEEEEESVYNILFFGLSFQVNGIFILNADKNMVDALLQRSHKFSLVIARKPSAATFIYEENNVV